MPVNDRRRDSFGLGPDDRACCRSCRQSGQIRHRQWDWQLAGTHSLGREQPPPERGRHAVSVGELVGSTAARCEAGTATSPRPTGSARCWPSTAGKSATTATEPRRFSGNRLACGVQDRVVPSRRQCCGFFASISTSCFASGLVGCSSSRLLNAVRADAVSCSSRYSNPSWR